MRRSSTPRTVARFTGVVLFAIVASITAQAETGRCVSAVAPGDVLLPDGSSHAAGRIEICMERKYSPVSGLHTTQLADGFEGMFLSQRSRSEGIVEDGQPYIQFLRASSGELILDAYAVPDGHERMWLYRMKPVTNKKSNRAGNPQLALALNDNDERQVVLLAAAAY